MAQTVAVVRQTLTATLSGTTDFTSSGFGTPTAAIIIFSNGNSTNNPQDNAIIGIGFWDGTNQRAVSVTAEDGGANSVTSRSSNDGRGLLFNSGGGAMSAYTVSAVTDGIRLTMSVDNTSLQRFATVILLKGVSANCGTFTPNATQNGTQASGSLGFAPGLVFFASIGDTVDNRNAATNAIFSFGLAHPSGHACILWSSANAAANEDANILFSETRCAGQVFGGALSWSLEITAFGADTFTGTTRDGASGSDIVFYLALGGADLSFDCGTLTTPTSTGNDVIATDVSPDALLTFLSTATGTTVLTNSAANGLALGMADATNEYSHNAFVQDAAATKNTGSVASATQVIDLDTSSGGARADLIDATVTLQSPTSVDMTFNYSAVDATPRKGFWLVFGDAGAGVADYRHPSFCGGIGGTMRGGF